MADGSFFGFERWTLDGRPREIVRVDVAPPDLDPLVAVYRDSTLARTGDEETRRRREREIAEMEGPEEAAPVSAPRGRSRFGDDGRVADGGCRPGVGRPVATDRAGGTGGVAGRPRATMAGRRTRA